MSGDRNGPMAIAREPARAGAWLITAATLLVNTACYHYLPAPGGALPVGRDVLVELTADGSKALQSAIGPRIRVVEGRVREVGPSGVATIGVERLTSWDGVTVVYTGRDPVAIPQPDIARADVRTFDRKRSWVAGGVIGGVFLTAVVTALLKARSRASGDPGRLGGSPPDLRAPLRVPLRAP